MMWPRQGIFFFAAALTALIWVKQTAHAQVTLPASAPAPARAADRPEAIKDAGWLQRLGEQQRILTNAPCQVCFIGDSLTEFWLHHGRGDWELHFAPLKSVNLGLAADRTEHILERIRRLDFSRARPKVVVLMMGTNNLGMNPPDTPEAVFQAVQRGVTMIQAKMPQARLILLTLPPSGDEPRSALRQRIQETNRLITEAKWPDSVRCLAVYDIMVDADDRWKKDGTLDGTHFSATGYSRLADVLAPVVKEVLKSK